MRAGHDQPFNRTAGRMLSALALAALAACGGGGGADETDPVAGPGGTPGDGDQVVAIDALPTGTRAFNVKIDARWKDAAKVEQLTGGTTRRNWNMANVQHTMTPGMKLAFFGRSPECGPEEIKDGPVTGGEEGEFATVAGRTGVTTLATSPDMRWTPSAAVEACPDGVKRRTGPHWIYVDPRAGGAVGVYTSVGPDASGQPPFLQATPASGTDGQGYNANGIATFVAFRHAWGADDAVRPWRASDGQVTEARFVSRQSVGAMEVGPATSGVTAQVKQQVMFTVINTTCQKQRLAAGAGCHMQYLFNTAAARAGVTDWATYSPNDRAWLWFDRDQGALPIIDGHVPGKGVAALENASRLPLYRSAGNSSLHKEFTDRAFDVRISFEELQNGLRLVAARSLGLTPGQVGAEQLAQVWGPDWNNPDTWTLISTTFGQEIHNSEFETRRAWIGGGFSELYAGPAR